MKLDALTYRRQYLIAPREPRGLEDWIRTRCGTFTVVSHPDIEVTSRSIGTLTVVLIGQVLDPSHPERTNGDILEDVVKVSPQAGAGDLMDRTSGLGGRWVVMVSAPGASYVFHDAAGQRQIHYSRRADGVWCASQPRMLAEQFGLKPTKAAVAYQWQAFQKNREYWWPGDRTLYDEVRRLLPNHYLDLSAGCVHRYWPVSPLAPRDVEEVANEAAFILKGLISAAVRRSRVALSCTAGWDSRVLLAASREHLCSMFCFTFDKSRQSADQYVDVQIARRLLAKAKQKHHVIDVLNDTEIDFARVYYSNTDTPHPYWAPLAQAARKSPLADLMLVYGNVSEVARSFYCIPDLNANSLSRIVKSEDDPFVVDAMQAWIDGLSCPLGLAPADLFYWEQRAGSWCAMAFHETYDIACEAFAAYNCRQLLTSLLSVPQEYRQKTNTGLYRSIIRILWPELLDTPVNPRPSLPTRLSMAWKRRGGFRGIMKRLIMHEHSAATL